VSVGSAADVVVAVRATNGYTTWGLTRLVSTLGRVHGRCGDLIPAVIETG